MPIAYAQSTVASPGTVSSASLTFPSDNTANGLITVGLRIGTTVGSITSLTDSQSNTYSQIFTLTVSSGDHRSFCYYAQGITSGPNTVSIVLSSASILRWAIHEYTGLLASGALDTFASTAGLSTTPTSPTVTNAGVNQLLFGWGTSASSGTWSAGTNFTQRESLNGKFASEDRIVASSGSFNASANVSISNPWTMGIATFLSTSAAAASVVTPHLFSLTGVGV